MLSTTSLHMSHHPTATYDSNEWVPLQSAFANVVMMMMTTNAKNGSQQKHAHLFQVLPLESGHPDHPPVGLMQVLDASDCTCKKASA